MDRKLRRSAFVVMASCSAILLATTQASAVDYYGLESGDRNGGALTIFFVDGDKLKVCDQFADGHSAVGRLHNPYDGTVTNRWVSTGAGECKTFDFDVPERATIAISACIGEFAEKDFWDCRTRDDVWTSPS